MHIADGILSPSAIALGMAGAACGTAVGLRRLHEEDVPRAALLGATFYVASLIHVPVGFSSAHLLLTGLVGLLLGWVAFPVVFVGLLMQLVMFGHGGALTLGVNTVNMALPGVICWWVFGRGVRSERRFVQGLNGFAAGAGGVLMSAVLTVCTIATAGPGMATVGAMVVLPHLPIMVAEGFVTAGVITFLGRVKPEMLAEARKGRAYA
jgi:cobalt/nickel transport system permease protein